MDKARKKKMLLLSGKLIIIIAIIGFVTAIVLDSMKRSRPYTLSSKGVRTVAEKVKKIEPHFKLRTKVEGIEYYCEVRPSAIIGPSHYDDVIAVKVALSDINIWLENYHHLSTYDGEKSLSNVRNIKRISLTNDIWRRSSKPEVYIAADTIIVFRAEGILIIQRSN